MKLQSFFLSCALDRTRDFKDSFAHNATSANAQQQVTWIQAISLSVVDAKSSLGFDDLSKSF